jgi:hypothetical protein
MEGAICAGAARLENASMCLTKKEPDYSREGSCEKIRNFWKARREGTPPPMIATLAGSDQDREGASGSVG